MRDALVLTPMGLRFKGRVMPCAIGWGGVSVNKREGDGATPAGQHQIAQMFYRPDRLPRLAPWAIPVGPGDLWCDDPDHRDYNHHVRAPFPASHEKLRRADPLYDVILTTTWNWPQAVAGHGSAIFIHQWRRPGYATAGCIALSRRDVLWIAQLVRPGTEVIVTQGSPRFAPRRRAQSHDQV